MKWQAFLFRLKRYKLKTSENNEKLIFNDDGEAMTAYPFEDENTFIDNIRKIRINGIPLPELAVVSNWQEEETKLLGSPEKFDQSQRYINKMSSEKLIRKRPTVNLITTAHWAQ